MESHKDCPMVQDAYSLRCMPQVHGASRQAFKHAREVLAIEINSATDNPLVFPDQVISGGNFHGQPLALVLDYVGIALAELAEISERRTERLVNPALSNGLPAFLTRNGGRTQARRSPDTAAAIVSENKVLAHPVFFADSIDLGQSRRSCIDGHHLCSQGQNNHAQPAPSLGYRTVMCRPGPRYALRCN